MTDTITSLDKSLSTIIDGATEKGAKLVDFLYNQAPDVINQLLIYHGVESAAKCLGGLVLILVCPFIIVKLIKLYQKMFEQHIDKDWNSHPGFIAPTIVFAVFGFMFTQIAGWDAINLTWLKIWIAPKVYLLEYITQIGK